MLMFAMADLQLIVRVCEVAGQPLGELRHSSLRKCCLGHSTATAKTRIKAREQAKRGKVTAYLLLRADILGISIAISSDERRRCAANCHGCQCKAQPSPLSIHRPRCRFIRKYLAFHVRRLECAP
jgi:hypothetical protein